MKTLTKIHKKHLSNLTSTPKNNKINPYTSRDKIGTSKTKNKSASQQKLKESTNNPQR
jgi:hypothetical protein